MKHKELFRVVAVTASLTLLGMITAAAVAEPGPRSATAERARMVLRALGTGDTDADLNGDGIVDADDVRVALREGRSTEASSSSFILPSVWVTTDEATVAVFQAAEPWALETTLPAPGPSALVRPIGSSVVLFDRQSGALRVHHAGTRALQASAQAPDAPYVDLAVIDKETMVVTRSDDSALWRLDVPSGRLTRWTDLSAITPSGEVADNRMMSIVGRRLCVQVQPSPSGAAAVPTDTPRARLAVVELHTGRLVAAEPLTPGVQGVELAGTLPTSDMHVSADGSWLLVSSPGELNTPIGGIERIDLNTLRSEGVVVPEVGPVSYAQLGGFGMTARERGVFVFHTDLAHSSHLQWFDLDGPLPYQPVYDSLGGASDAFASATRGGLIFFADKGNGVAPTHPPGMLVVDANARRVLTDTPRPTPGVPVDIAVVP